MSKDGAPFIMHGSGNYTCCYGVYNCGNHVPTECSEDIAKKRRAGLRPCNSYGPCKCYPDKNWSGSGGESCDVLKEFEKAKEAGALPPMRKNI